MNLRYFAVAVAAGLDPPRTESREAQVVAKMAPSRGGLIRRSNGSTANAWS